MGPTLRELDLRRVVVVGTSCCGKTTFARKLSIALDAQPIELDTLYWKPGWVARPLAEFRELVREESSVERWVADGNYSVVRDVLWQRATSVVWLNYSFPRVFSRALTRTIRRAVFREELFAGNRESLRLSFFSRDSILLWILRTFWKNRSEFSAIKNSEDWKHLRFREFRSPAQASEFLDLFDDVGIV